MVFGVCLVAVSCLYLVPSLSGSSSRVNTSSGPHDVRTTPPDPTTNAPSAPANSSSQIGNATSSALPDPGSTTPTRAGVRSADARTLIDQAEPANPVGATSQRPTVQRAVAGQGRPAATAADAGADHAPPTAISRLWSTGADPESLGLAWTAASDDRSSVWYEVWVNGFKVTDTQQTEATVTWFNDSRTHVIQVRAVDPAGNRGPWSPTLMVTRPSPPPDLEPASKTAQDAGTSPAATPSDSGSPKEDNS